MAGIPLTGPQSGADERGFTEDLRTVIAAVRRGWRFIIVGVLVSMSAAIIYLAKRHVVYQGTSRLLILQQGRAPLATTATDSGRLADANEDYVPTHAIILKSPMIVGRAVEALGLPALTTHEALERLTVTRPDPTAKVLQLVYQSEDPREAVRLVDAIILSYQHFLEETYQKTNKDIVKQLRKARDELGNDLGELEKKYLEIKREDEFPGLDEAGLSLQARRLEQWDHAANEVMVKAVQLRAQLALGRKLASEGAEPSALASALSQLGGGVPPASGVSGTRERILEDLSQVELQREATSKLLERLRASVAEARDRVSNDELSRAFYADPDATRLSDQIASVRAKLAASQRLARGTNDPSVVHQQKTLRELQDALNALWMQKQPALLDAVLAERIGANVAALRDAEANLMTLETRENTLRNKLAEGHAERLRMREEAARQAVAQYGPDSPQAREATAEVDRLRAAGLRGGAHEILAAVEKSLEAVELMQAEMRAKFDANMVDSKKAETSRLTVTNLRNDLERKRSLFNTVVDQLKQTQLVGDFSGITAQAIEPPTAIPVRPQVVLILALALAVGLTLGTGAAVLADQVDQRLHTTAELSETFGLTMLGALPKLPLSRGSSLPGSPAVMSHTMPRSQLAECFRVLRTHLDRITRDRRVQVIMVTSPHAGDGKSTTTSNLAISLAQNGKRVLLIDADLRRSSLPTSFSMSNEQGLTQMLRGSVPPATVILPTPVENLHLLAAGAGCENPAELLGSPVLREFIDSARQTYDVILIDTPPLLAVADPLILSGVADGVLVVARASSVRKSDATRALEVLGLAGLPVLGLVVNGAERDLGRWGGYGSSYGYAYTYGSERRASNGARLASPPPPPPPSSKYHDPSGDDGGDREGRSLDALLRTSRSIVDASLASEEGRI